MKKKKKPQQPTNLAGNHYLSDVDVISAINDQQDESFFINATLMEEVCGSQKRMCLKINIIWSHIP